MQQVLDLVRRTIRRHDLLGPQTRVVVALSGGSDSVALAHLLRELDATGDLHVAGVAHFNHCLRAAAEDDERFSTHLAQSLGWPCFVDRGDVAERARRERRSIEDAARTARHEFFERARLHFGADRVAVGHTRDDQAETFLLRLLRGAGPRGLAAMHPRTGAIVRPLLDCRRAELRAYLAERGIGYVDDASNQDVSIPRNRIRAELLPLLEHRFNPSIVDVLANEAALARDEWLWMESAAKEAHASLTSQVSSVPDAAAFPLGSAEADLRLETSDFDVAALRAVPLALRRVVVWRAMTDAARGRPVAFRHVEAALRLVNLNGAADESGSIDAPGHRVHRIGSRLVLKSRPPGTTGRLATSSSGPANLFHYPLSIPGEVQLPEAGWLVSAETGAPGLTPPEISETSCTGVPAATAGVAAVAIVRRDLCRGPLAVRNRRPGDWFKPVGLGGSKKLQDFFVDRKVARARRDTVPLVVDETDRIVWVAGFGIDEAFRVTDPAQAVLILKLKLLGGSA